MVGDEEEDEDEEGEASGQVIRTDLHVFFFIAE